RRGRRRSVRRRRCHHRVCTSAVGTLPLIVLDAIPDPTPRSPVPVVIDTDPGIDDCLALLLALNSPELEVRGISISYGNTYVENAFRNAVAILRKLKRTVIRFVGGGGVSVFKRDFCVALDTPSYSCRR